MEFYEKEDRDLGILGCLWHLIEHWRFVLLSAIIFSVLFGMLKYVKDSRDLQEIAQKNAQLQANSVFDIKKRMEMLSGSQKDNMEMAVGILDALIETKVYAETSSVMKLNPYNAFRVVLQYTVKTDENQVQLLHAYKNCILSEKSKVAIVAASGNAISVDDVEDMITVNDLENMLLPKNKGNVPYNINEMLGTDQDEKSVIYFTIRGFDKESAANMAETVKGIISDYSVETVRNKESHELTLVSENQFQGRDQSLVDLKNDTYKNLFDLNEKIKTLKTSMDGEQVNMLEDYQTALENNADESNIVQKSGSDVGVAVSLNKIWILLGMIFGIAVSFGVEVLWWFEGGRLNYAEEIQHDFNIPILGTLVKRKKRKLFGFVDEWIYRIKNRNINILTEEQEYHIILSRILLKAKKENLKEVYLIGTVPECFTNNSLVSRLTEELRKEGVFLMKGNHIGNDPETLFKVSKMGYVVIWEETEVSKYQEIIREVMLCKEQNVNILGSIVLCSG